MTSAHVSDRHFHDMYNYIVAESLDSDVVRGLQDKGQPMELQTRTVGVVNVAMKVSLTGERERGGALVCPQCSCRALL